jgi:hypothetical protein
MEYTASYPRRQNPSQPQLWEPQILHFSYKLYFSFKKLHFSVRIFSSPRRPDRLWGAPNLLSNWFRGFLLENKAAGAWSWSLTSN